MVLILLVAVSVHSEPARKIYDLRILGCGCEFDVLYCTYRQMGYGNVYTSYSSGSVSS